MLAQHAALINAVFDSGSVDMEQILATLDDWVPVVYTEDVAFSETPTRIDARTVHGHEGVKEAFTRFYEQWDTYSAKLVDVEDHGERAFVVMAERATGKGSRAPVESTLYVVLDFRDGRICRYQEFYDEMAARAALTADAESAKPDDGLQRSQ
jgi:ketosteroid isomerase-like protein